MIARHRGYALIECLMLITVMAVMLGLCAGTIHLLLKLDRSGRSAADEAGDLARLARDFRADAHASSPIDNPGRPADRLTLPIAGGRTVEYQVRPLDLLRTVREGEKVRHREAYRKPARSSVRFDLTSEGPRRFAALVVDRPAEFRDASPYHDHRIEAELGKDRRMTGRPE